MPDTRGELLACHDCDLLQRAVACAGRGNVRCGRCGALLYRERPGALDRSRAWVLAAAILFVLANAFPIVELEMSGQRAQATLLGAVALLHQGGMTLVAALVALTTFIAPGLEIALMAYILLPRTGRGLPPSAIAVLRLLQGLRPWSMTEVFVLGVLVSVVKLAHMADVVIGVALWSWAGFIILLAALTIGFDLRALWARIEPAR
jgi:paraquat-inducible protein A